MPLYQNGVIYKLKHTEDYDDLNIYIGSTTNFRGRKNCHKTSCNSENNKNYNLKVYQYIRDNGGWDEWVMIPIEQYFCNDKKELEIKERHYIDILRPALNKIIPTRTCKEYYEDNKEKLKEYSKEYYESNKEKIKEKEKEYYVNNKEKKKEQVKKYYENNIKKLKKQHKEYYVNNKEIVNQKHKEYYVNNKEIVNQKHKEYYESNKEKIKEKVICDHCGGEYNKSSLKKHQKSKKCIDFKKD